MLLVAACFLLARVIRVAWLADSFSRPVSGTVVNDQMGAKTQVSGLIAACAVALVLLFLTEPIRTCRRRCSAP